MLAPHYPNQSEVARLRERIECEQKAATWALTGPTIGTAQHWFISRRMERIGRYQEQLALLIGEQASLALIIEILENSPAQKREQDRHERQEGGC